MDGFDRRAVLAGAATLLAGCATGPATDARTRDGTAAGDTTTRTATPTRGTSGAPTTAALDLREANVTGVAVERAGDGEFRFDVTLYHDDEGEDGYANWWQVERLDGERLGRRDLLHAHGTREFTRSETVVVGDSDCVVVRGHDETHGYGGRAVLVALPSGATRGVRQGSDPRSFTDADCP